MLIAAVVAGCAPRSGHSGGIETTPPSWSSVRESWNARAESIMRLYGRGIFETRWTDEDGSAHVEQGYLDLWYERSDRLASRVSKFGETFAVTGMNETSMWLHLEGEQSVFYSGQRVEGTILSMDSMPVDPRMYRSVLGLSPLTAVADRPDAIWNPEAEAWVFDLPVMDPAMPTRLWMRPSADYPFRLEYTLSSDGGRLVVEHDPRRTRVIELPDQPVTRWPVFCNSVSLELHSSDRLLSRSLVVFDRLSCEVDQKIMDRVFDLDVMRDGLGPDRIESLGRYAPAEGASP